MRKSIRKMCIYVTVLVATLLFADKAIYLIIEKVGKYFYWLDSCLKNDILIFTLCICVSAILLLCPMRRISAYKSLKRNSVTIMLSIIYVFAIMHYRDTFTKFSVIQRLAYADVMIVWLAVWYFTPFLRNRNNKVTFNYGFNRKSKLKGDDLYPKDELQRIEEARAICDYIMDESNDYSTTLAISITGSWGSGKTVLMNYMKKCLEDKGIPSFDYSPWQRSEKDVALDFINRLNHHLYDHSNGLVSLDEYIKTLKVSNITGWFNLILHALIRLITGREKHTSDLLMNVSSDMNNLKEPVVAFIDDVDRISKDDFMDVMRLIRATANFPNLVYVVAYDRNRALKLLCDEYDEGFLTKIFNVNHLLTNISDDKLHELVLERFKEYGVEDERESPFALMDLTDYLPTIREIKRFFNLMSKDYWTQTAMRRKTYFNFDFYAKLELLKYTDLLTYNMLKRQPTLYLEVDKDSWNDVPCYKTKDDLDLPNKATEQLLLQMFDQDSGEDNMFICPGGLQIMFENDLDNSYVSKQEFEKSVQEDRLVEKVKEWIDQRKQGVFFCLSKNLQLPTELFVKVLEILVGDNPSDLITKVNNRHDELYDNSSLDRFSRIDRMPNPYDYVQKYHGFFLYLKRNLWEGNKKEEEEIQKLYRYAAITESPRELLAIICGMMKEYWAFNEVPERWQINLANILFNRLASKEPIDELRNQFYVVEAMQYLPVFDAASQLLLPLLKKNPAIWLRLTLNIDSDLRPVEKMTVNTNVLHSLFDTYDTYKVVMKKLKQCFEGNKNILAMLKEHLLLTERTSLIVAYSSSQFDANKYPSLLKIRYTDNKKGILMSTYYEDTKDMMKKGGCVFFNNEGQKPDLVGDI